MVSEENRALMVNICGLELSNPLIAASGCYGFGLEYQKEVDINLWGGIATKAITLEGREGNLGQRIYETPSGLLNSIGLENPGLKYFCKNILPEMKSKLSAKIIVNISGYKIEEYAEMASVLKNTAVDLLEVNISCPNVKDGGMVFGMKPEAAKNVVAAVKKNCGNKPVMVKLTPNAPDVALVASACEEAGADALSLVNTFKGLAVDVKKKQAVFKNLFAGLSGPAIKPLALRFVYEVSKAVSVPVIGLGGIQNADDVLAFMMAGATAVQIGTANFYNPQVIKNILADLTKYKKENKIKSLSEIRGII